MLTFISVSCALLINFLIPDLKIVKVEQQFNSFRGYPLDYNDFLDQKDIDARVLIIYHRIMIIFSIVPVISGTPSVPFVNLIKPELIRMTNLLPLTISRIPSTNSNIYMSKTVELLLAKNSSNFVFTQKEIDEFNFLIHQWNNNVMTEDQIILQIRGGQLNNWVAQFGITIALIIIMNNIESFNLEPIRNFPPKMQILYENQNQGDYKKDPRKNSPTYSETIKFYDGFEAEILKVNADHLLTKHGHIFGIEDRLPPLEPNKKHGSHIQIRTRLNSKNQNQFRENLKSFCQNPNLTVFENLKIRGQSGRGYYCRETFRFIGILNEGALAGKIVKAQSLSQLQSTILFQFNAID